MNTSFTYKDIVSTTANSFEYTKTMAFVIKN
jgi:hypothetical protein